MSKTLSCGCVIFSAGSFKFCPLHDAASDLLVALEKMREESQRFGDESDNADAIAGFERLESLACVAIAKVKAEARK